MVSSFCSASIWTLLFSITSSHISALTSTSGTYKIVGAAGGVQHLPASYASTFSFWTYDEGHLVSRTTQPACVDESLETRVRPSLDVLIKGGVPAYMLAGLQSTKQQGQQPPSLAQQWTTFNTLAVEPNARLFVYQGPGDGTDDRLLYVPPEDVRGAIETLGMELSKFSGDAMSTGFHVISFPLGPWATVTTSSSPTLITCLVTAEADPREIFTLEPHLIEMTATTFLQMKQ